MENENINRSFKGIWIPKEIWLNKELTMQEKVFLVEIDSLDNEEGCTAGNQYFADFFGISKNRVSLVIQQLVSKNYINSRLIYKDGSKQILYRVLNICRPPYPTFVREGITQKCDRGITQKCEDNNILNNNIDNNINNKKSKKEKKDSYDDIISKYIQDDELKKTIYEFIKMRKMIKKPLTNRALELLIQKLYKMTNDIAVNNTDVMIGILEQSIINNWQGIFPLKQESSSNKKNDGWDYINSEFNRIKEERMPF